MLKRYKHFNLGLIFSKVYFQLPHEDNFISLPFYHNLTKATTKLKKKILDSE